MHTWCLLVLAQIPIEPREQQHLRILLLACFAFAGLLLIVLSIPLLLGKVPPNWFYGVRTKKTLSSKDIWYKANKYSARDLIKLGVIQVLYNIVLIPFGTRILSFEPAGNLLILIVGTGIILVRALVYVRKL